MSLQLTLSKAMERALLIMSEELVQSLASKYGFSAEEAMSELVVREAEPKRSDKTAKKSDKSPKRIAEKKAEPRIPLPLSEIREDCCRGVKANHGLYTQCFMARGSEGLCKSCARQASKNESGEPDCGLIEGRQLQGEKYRDNKGRMAVHYTKVMKKLKLSKEDVLVEAGKFNIEIDEKHFEVEEMKRGRPKKATVEDTESEVSEKKGRGRPKKDVKVVSVNETEDLFASLMQQAQAASPRKEVVESSSSSASSCSGDDSESESDEEKAGKEEENKKKEEEKAAKALEKASKEEEKKKKEEEKAAKALEKGLEKSAKEEEKKKKEEEKSAKEEEKKKKEEEKSAKEEEKKKKEEEKAAKALEKASKEEEKKKKEEEKAAKALEKASKEEEKKKKEEEKAAKALEKAGKEEENKKKEEEKAAKAFSKAGKEVKAKTLEKKKEEESESEEEEVEVKVVTFEHNGVKYLKSSEGLLYNAKTHDVVGMWNELTSSIDEVELESESESEEDD